MGGNPRACADPQKPNEVGIKSPKFSLIFWTAAEGSRHQIVQVFWTDAEGSRHRIRTRLVESRN